MGTRGKQFQPGNTFGKGRPPGSRNKVNPKAQALLAEYAEPVVKLCIKKALQGDPKALQLCMERMAPVPRDQPVKIGKLPLHTLSDVAKASETVIEKVSAGQITPTQGQTFAALIEGRRRVIQTEEIEARLRALEEGTGK